MLLHSTPCQQPGRTSTFLRYQCHRPGPDLLESQTSTKTCSTSGTLAVGYRLDSSPSTTSHCPTSTTPSTTTPPYRLLPQALSSQNSPQSWTVYAITRKRLPDGLTARLQSVHVQSSDNIHLLLINPINISSSTETNLRFCRCTFYIYCYGFTSKQDLSTIPRNLQITPFSFADMTRRKLTSVTTKSTP